MHSRFAPRTMLLTTALALGACQHLTNLAGGGTVAGGGTGGAGPSAGATATTQRTDADTSQVIGALAALGARPIEALSVERARSQPTPADAVRVLGSAASPPRRGPCRRCATSRSRPRRARSRRASTARRAARVRRRWSSTGTAAAG